MSFVGRLLVAALCASSLPACAQDHPTAGSPAPSNLQTGQTPDFRSAPPSSEPWRIFPSAPSGDKTPVFLAVPDENNLLTADGLSTDKVCYAIRSYVVARDSKDSDSVHAVGYSTCQPASRYRLKTTVLQQDSSDR